MRTAVLAGATMGVSIRERLMRLEVRRLGPRVQAWGVVSLVALAHALLPLLPGLPSLMPTQGALQQLSSVATQLLAVQATLFGAALVALFFALGSVQHADRTKAGMDRLVTEVGLGPTVGLLAGALLGSGLTTLFLSLSTWAQPVNAPSLGFLPLLDLLLFAASVIILARLFHAAPRFLHPMAVQELSRQEALRLARAVTRHERREKIDRQGYRDGYLAKRIDRRGYFDGHQGRVRERAAKTKTDDSALRFPEVLSPPERAHLEDLLRETYEYGVRAIESDDVPRLRWVLSVLLASVEGYVAERANQEDARLEHARSLHGPPDRPSDLSSLCLEWLERDYYSLLELAAIRAPSRCGWQLLGFPLSVWSVGLRADFHRVARLGLKMAAETYPRVARSNRDLVVEWRRVWRYHPMGPESFLREASSAIRPDDVTEDQVLHYLLAAHEARESFFAAAGLALLRGDTDTCSDLVSSRAAAVHMFWPIRDPKWTFSDAAKTRLDQIEHESAAGMVYLGGLAAAQSERDQESGAGLLEFILEFILDEALREEFEMPARLADVINAYWNGAPEWFYQALRAGPAPSGDEEPSEFTGPSAAEVLGWGFMVLAPRLVKRGLSLTPEDFTNLGELLPELHSVVERIGSDGERWAEMVPPSFLKIATRGLAKSGSRRTATKGRIATEHEPAPRPSR